MQLLKGHLRVFHHRAFGNFQLQHGRVQRRVVEHLGDLLVKVTMAKQPAGNVHRNKLQRPPLGLPLHHLQAGLTQHPGVDIGDQPGALGNRDELPGRHQPALRMLPAHQRLDADHLAAEQVMHGLVIHPEFFLLQCPTQLPGGLDPLLGMGGQLFGVQRIARAAVALGLEQRRIGIAQQLLGAQGVAGEQADADADADEQALAVDLERRFHAVDDALRQSGGLAHLRAVLGQYGKFVTTQAGQGHAVAQQRLQALTDHLEQLVADVVAEAVVNALEVVQVEQQQGAAALVGLGRRQCLLGAVVEQQAVGQVGERVVMSEIRQLTLGMLDRADVAEHRDVMTQLAAVIADGANRLPLRIHLAAFAPVPDLAAPLALLRQGGVNLLVERRTVTAGFELARALAEHFVLVVAGDLHERPVHVHDQAIAVGHQYPFQGAVEHRGSHAQALAVLAAQAHTDADEIEQAGARDKNQQGATQHPEMRADQLPAGDMLRRIEKTVQ
ncbi:hypothetical protein D3C78_860470 [compost metagenome]